MIYVIESKRIPIVAETFGILGLIALFGNEDKEMLAVIFFIIGILGYITRKSFKIDLTKHRIKKYWNISKWEIGSWSNIPDIQYLSILRTKPNKRIYSTSLRMFIQVPGSKYAYGVRVILKDHSFITLYRTYNKNDSIIQATKISKSIGLKVLDHTSF